MLTNPTEQASVRERLHELVGREDACVWMEPQELVTLRAVLAQLTCDLTTEQTFKVARLHEAGWLDQTLDQAIRWLDLVESTATAAAAIARASHHGVTSAEREALLAEGDCE